MAPGCIKYFPSWQGIPLAHKVYTPGKIVQAHTKSDVPGPSPLQVMTLDEYEKKQAQKK